MSPEPALDGAAPVGDARRRLVLRRRFSTFAGTALMFLDFLVCILGGFGFAFAIEQGEGPFVKEGSLAASVVGKLVVAGSITTAVAVSFWLADRTGSIALDGTGVVDDDGSGDMGVPWAELEGYRDGELGRVELVARGRHLLRRRIHIPTRTEADRVAVLAIMDRVGLSRLE